MAEIIASDFMKGRYNLMKIFVDIDIAKLNHFAAAISSNDEIVLDPFKFTNDADGFQLPCSFPVSYAPLQALHNLHG